FQKAKGELKLNRLSDVTQILDRVEKGDDRAAEELLPLVYGELRKLAAHMMVHQPPGQTLQATALVHEAWLKLAGADVQQWHGRKHFFSAAAEAMRHILIDRARKRLASRHGGAQERLDIDDVQVAAPVEQEIILGLNEALDEFEKLDPAKAEV